MRIPEIFKSEPKTTWLLLSAIILLGAITRFFNLNFGLPFRYRPDEQIIIEIALKFGSGDLNPHFFDYPSLLFYLLFFIYGIFFVIGKVAGLFGNSTEYMGAYFADPTVWHLIGRSFIALLGTACIPLVYIIGKRAYGKAVGLAAAFWLAFIFIHVRDSHFISTDILMNFFLLCAFLGMTYILKTESLKSVLLTAVFIGLAVGAKYPAGALVIPFVLAVMLKPDSGNSQLSDVENKFINRLKKLVIAYVLMVSVFFITTPFALIDLPGFAEGLIGRVDHASTGHSGVVLNGWIHHITFSLRYGLRLPLLLLSIGGILLAIIRRTKSDYLLLSFIFSYYLAIGSSHTAFARYAIPLVPLLLILNARFLVEACERFIKSERIVKPVIIGLSLLFIAPSFYAVWHFNRLLGTKDTRTIAREWIEENISGGTVVFTAEHGPELTMAREQIKELHDYNLEHEPGYSGRRAQWELEIDLKGKDFTVYKLHNKTFITYDINYETLQKMYADKKFAEENLEKYISGTTTKISFPTGFKLPSSETDGILLDTLVNNFNFELDEKWHKESEEFPCQFPIEDGARFETIGFLDFEGEQIIGFSPFYKEPRVLSPLKFDKSSTSMLNLIPLRLKMKAVYSPIDAFFVPWSGFRNAHRQGPPLLLVKARYIQTAEP